MGQSRAAAYHCHILIFNVVKDSNPGGLSFFHVQRRPRRRSIQYDRVSRLAVDCEVLGSRN